MASNAKAVGRFGKQDFAYLPDEDVYRCPSGQLLPYHFTNIEHGITLRRYDAMRRRHETVEHPFGTIKARMGATHFLTKRLENVAAEMVLWFSSVIRTVGTVITAAGIRLPY